MDSLTKLLMGAAATALVGWLSYSATCNAGAASSVAAAGSGTMAAVTATPASAEKVAACQTDVNKLMTGKTVNFQSGSAYLAASSNALVAELATSLKACAGTVVEVQGHTDLSGSAEVNMELSQARAENVVKALVTAGVPAAQLSAKGFGLTQPLENARSAEADAKNRRTVFAVSAAAQAAPTGGQ